MFGGSFEHTKNKFVSVAHKRKKKISAKVQQILNEKLKLLSAAE
jgi:hypothetical protein